MDSGGKRDESPTPEEPKKPKAAGWRISEDLRHLLTSHAEYLSAKFHKEVSTENMVAEWLDDRLKIEDRKRALETLHVKEQDLPKPGV